jgi:hypothetical protein
MDAGGDTGSGRHMLGLRRAHPSGQRPHATTRWPSRPGVDQEAAEAMSGPPLLEMPGSFDLFYQQEYSGLVQLAFVLSGSRYGAEDIAQDALVAAWKRWRELEQPLA